MPLAEAADHEQRRDQHRGADRAKQRKRRRLGHSANGIVHHRPEAPNHVWSYDFVTDQTEDGRRLKIFELLDEFTRRVISLEAGRSFRSGDVIEVLERMVAEHGAPAFIRSDNGPEFIAMAIRKWLADSGIETLYIAPGSPWERIESQQKIDGVRLVNPQKDASSSSPGLTSDPSSMTRRRACSRRWRSSRTCSTVPSP